MKKIIAILLAVMLVASFSVSAFAAGSNDDAIKAVEAQLVKSAEAIFKDADFNYENAGDFLLYIRSGADYSSKWDAFDQSVKGAFDNNTALSLYQFSNILLCYIESGEDDETALSLINKLTSYEPTFASAYEARSIFEAAAYADDDAFLEKLQNAFVPLFVEGQGYDYWGYSCDNNAAYAAALGMLPINGNEAFDKYEIADKVFELIENYKLDDGYAYLTQYGASADSTAYVLMAKSIFDRADTTEAYNLLQAFANDDGTYNFGGAPSAYSTKNAIIGLEYYLDYLYLTNVDDSEDTSQDVGTGDTPEVVASKATTTPSTGDNLGVILSIASLAVISAAGAAVVKTKKED